MVPIFYGDINFLSFQALEVKVSLVVFLLVVVVVIVVVVVVLNNEFLGQQQSDNMASATFDRHFFPQTISYVATNVVQNRRNSQTAAL